MAAVRTPVFSEVKRTIALDFSEVKRTIHLFLYDDFVLLYDDFDCNICFGPVILLRHEYCATFAWVNTICLQNGVYHWTYRTWGLQPKWMAVCLSWAF